MSRQPTDQILLQARLDDAASGVFVNACNAAAAAIAISADRLALREMARRSNQSLSGGPNCGCSSIHRSSAGLPR